ncbi:tyrosine-protein phosphatase [Lacimonas salitolerans]|uniref:Tyrosine-protein phosphatase n=1 Tax=Lacimonas salitolerans TaxID=1323750 RepID=A0ABW4EIT4_9RHOB
MTQADGTLRPLPLPENVPGRIWLTAMPGRFEKLAVFLGSAENVGATDIVCLVTDEDIKAMSPEYAQARLSDALSLTRRDHPIPDRELPQDEAEFQGLIMEICAGLHEGRRMIVHCAAGIGRTGLLAQQILMALGLEPSQAHLDVREAGSGPENAAQKDFCKKPFVQFRP